MAMMPWKWFSFNSDGNTATRDAGGLTLLDLHDAAAIVRADTRQAQAEKTALAAEAIAPQLFTLTSGDGEDPQFRRITSPQTLRDLNPMMHDRMLQVCYYLGVTTPFGKRIIEIITSYVMGEGLSITAKDPAVQEVIDAFWNDPINRMDAASVEWQNELTIFGELCVPVVRNTVDGKVRVGYVDPMNIDVIQYAEMKGPDTVVGIRVPYGVKLRREVGEPIDKKALKIVAQDEDPNSETFGTLQGDCFYWTLNKVKSASRGFSELFSLADWIDVYDQMNFDMADRMRLMNAMLWHYKVEGADEKSLAEMKNKLTKDPPRMGGSQFTNEKVSIEAMTPDLKGGDQAAIAKEIKTYGLGGAGMTAQMFADGDANTKATADAMSGPTGKKFKQRQNHYEECLSSLLNFVIDSAVQAGVLPETIDRSFQIDFPSIEVKDLVDGSQTLQSVTVSLTTAEDRAWIRGETAARAFMTVMSEIGVEIDDPRGEYEAAQQEQQDKKRAEQNSLDPQGNLALALQQIKKGALPAAAIVDPKLQDAPSADTVN